MARLIEFSMGPRAGKTTTAIALVHGFRAQGLAAVYVAPTQRFADWVARAGMLPPDWVVAGARGVYLRVAAVYVLDDVGLFERSPEGDPVQIALQRVQTFVHGAVYAFC